MEYIYFSRPDSNLDGINVHTTRKLAGKQLYYENPIDADVVIGVPDSSISAAIDIQKHQEFLMKWDW